VDGDGSQFIDVVGTDSQAPPIIHESGSPPHPDDGGSPHEADSQPPDGGSQCLDVSDDGDGGEGQGMDDSVIVIPGSPRRGGGRERDVSVIDISDSSKVPVPEYIRICSKVP
jgi:hypothetical protein